MRKLFVTLATVGFLLTAASCSKEGTETVFDGKNDISFNAAIGKSTVTRATEFGYWADAATLNVFAYKAGTTADPLTFALTYDAATPEWTYSPTVMQPGYALRYYSYANATGATNVAATATSYAFDYAVKATAATQEDLIAAKVSATMDSDIQLQFKHLLSQVNFAVVNTFGVTVEVDDIEVDVKNSSGSYDFESNAWTLASTAVPGAYDYTPYSDETDSDPNNHIFSNITDGTGSPAISYMGNNNNDRGYDNALMLMPQTFAAEADGTFSFTFDLEVLGVDKDASGAITVNFCDFEVTTWEAGKNYVYIIDFTNYFAGGPIKFSVSVTDWEDTNIAPWTDVAQTIQVAMPNEFSIKAAIAAHSAANTENEDLTVFPIAVDVDLAADLVLDALAAFDFGDQVRIEFPSATGAAFLKLDESIDFDVLATADGWKKTTSGRVVTLTYTEYVAP